MRLVVLTGTGTAVGKTFVAAGLALGLRERGLTVAARKPLQSLHPGAGPTDASVLAAATGEPEHDVCPPSRTFPLAMAPPMAAQRLGRAIPNTTELVKMLSLDEWGAAVGLVELAGGIRSPFCSDGDCLAFIEMLQPTETVVVAEAGLGVINAVRLCMATLCDRPALVYLNRFDPDNDLHLLNRNWLMNEGHRIVTSIGDLVQVVSD